MAAADRGQRVNRSQLADVFGVSLPTVDGWVRAGVPILQRGGRGIEWAFSTAAVAEWLRDRAVENATGGVVQDAEALKLRKLAAETAATELELLKARKDVAPVAEFKRAEARRNAEIRSRVMNVPQRVVVQLLGETDEARFKDVLRTELVAALTAAAEADITDAEENDDESEE